MTLAPSDLRAGDWTYLAEFDWAGQTFRLAEISTKSVPFGLQGANVDFVAGLDIGSAVGNELALFADIPADETVNATLSLAALADVPILLQDGHTPLGAELRIYHHPIGSGKRRQVFRGIVQQYEYADKASPLSITARQSLADDVGSIHAPEMRFGERSLGPHNVTWEWDEQQAESWFPVVIGKPGSGGASLDADDHFYGSPAFGATLNSGPTAYACAAGHPTGGGSVFAANISNGQTVSATMTQLTAVNGLNFAAADISGFTSPHWDDGDEIWLDWGDSGGGLVDAEGNLVRHAGAVLLWLARLAENVALDLIRLETVAPQLRSFLIDTSIVPEPGETIEPWLWAEEHLLPILPVSPTRGPEGMYLVTWRPDATAKDAVVTIKTGTGGNAARASDVESSTLKGIANEFVIEYAVDARTDKPTKRLTLTGDPVELANNDDAVQDMHCWRSFEMFGRRVADPIKTDVVWQDDTALAVLQWHARRYALPSEVVTFRCKPELAWVEPGQVATVTDKDIGLTSRVALIEVANIQGNGDVLLQVRLYATG